MQFSRHLTAIGLSFDRRLTPIMTVMQSSYDHLTTYITTAGLPLCGLLLHCGLHT